MDKRVVAVLFGVTALVVWVLVACAPRPAPPAAPAPAAFGPAPATAAPTKAPAAAPEDPWTKVVAAAKREGAVTIYTFSFTGSLGEAVRREFEKIYGIKVEVVGGTGATLLERIKAEQGAKKYIADTYDTAPAFVLTAKAQGLLQSPGDLPIFSQKIPWRLSPFDTDKTIAAIWTTVCVPFYNTQSKLAGQPPRSFKELLDNKWKAQIAMAPPAIDPLPIYVYVAGKKFGIVDDEYFRRLGKQDLKVVPTVRDVSAAVARGEAPVSFLAPMSVANPFILEGAPMRPIEPEEGVIMTWGSTIGVVNNAPHPNAARLFMNWLLTPEGQIAAAKVRGIMPIRSDVTDFTPEAARLSLKKTLPLEFPDLEEISRLQRAMVVDNLLGLQK